MYVSKKNHWNEQRVKALLSAKTPSGMPSSPEAVMAALTVTWNNQTADEQATDQTRHLNGQGFTDRDADFGSSLVKQYAEWGRLSVKQWEYAQKMALRYWSQFAVALEAERNAVMELEHYAGSGEYVDPRTGEIVGASAPQPADRFTWKEGDLHEVDDDNPFAGWDADEQVMVGGHYVADPDDPFHVTWIPDDEPDDIRAERLDAERMSDLREPDEDTLI